MIHCTVVQLASFARRGPSSTAISHNVRLHRLLLSKRHDLRLTITSAQRLEAAMSSLDSVNGTAPGRTNLFGRNCRMHFPYWPLSTRPTTHMIRLSHLNFFSKVVFFAFHCVISSAKCLLRIEMGHLRMHVASASMFPRSTNVSAWACPALLLCKRRTLSKILSNPDDMETVLEHSRAYFLPKKKGKHGTFDSSGWTKWSCRDVSLNTYTCLGTTISYISQQGMQPPYLFCHGLIETKTYSWRYPWGCFILHQSSGSLDGSSTKTSPECTVVRVIPGARCLRADDG